MYINRDAAATALKFSRFFRVVAILGPRQAGKTTLARHAFPEHAYVSLENPDTLLKIQSDPRLFLTSDYGEGVIIDEFHRFPQLLSYLQEIVDSHQRAGYFVLTGSHNFLMNQAITQSLAGRVGIVTLLPLSVSELSTAAVEAHGVYAHIFKGGYPAVWTASEEGVSEMFASQYIQTYLERDVRMLENIVKLADFRRFLALCAGRVGQVLNITSLATDTGVSVPTVREWLSVLEASYLIFLISPHHKNFNKRLVKAPKLYFYDTGLACYLLQIRSQEQLFSHYARGGLFESFIFSEMSKAAYHAGRQPQLFFWRDSLGREVDCIIDHGATAIPVEIKSTSTYNARFFDGISYWRRLAGDNTAPGYAIYAGNEDWVGPEGTVIGWQRVASLMASPGSATPDDA